MLIFNILDLFHNFVGQKYEKYLLYANEHTIFFLFSVKSNTKHLVNFTRYFSFLSCITSITCKYDIF